MSGLLALLRRPFPLRIGWDGLVPVVLLGGLFALVARQVGAPIAGAAVVGAVCGSASLLVHELGHFAAACRVDGVRPRSVSLMWGGAATTLEGAYRRGGDQIQVALAGPGASLALAAALLPVFTLPMGRGARDLVLLLILFNAMVAVVNVVPIEPLDGYKVVVGLFWSALGSEASARRLIRRVAFGGIAVEALTALVLLAEKPLLGSTSIAIGCGLYGQKLLVRRLRRPARDWGATLGAPGRARWGASGSLNP